MATVEGGNLYDMNKSIIAQYEKEIRGKALFNKVGTVVMPYFKEKLQHYQYFMLLCHEKRDYTVFNLCNGQYFLDDNVKDITDNFMECILNRGAIFGLDRAEDEAALEIWIRDENDEMVCYYLFPYDSGVVEV